MISKAAVLHGIHQPWTIEDIEIGAPRAGEVLVEWKSAGMCHSDDHLVTGDMVPPPEVLAVLDGDFFPIIGGHEGAGVIVEVGPEVHTVAVGDHVAASFLPSCGRSLGATHTAASMLEALPLVRELTHGYLAEKVIMTPSVMYGELLGEGLSLVGKGGTLVCTAVAPMSQTTASINLFELAMWSKEVKGTIFGSLSPRAAVPSLLQMYRVGSLKLDELITRRYSLGEINEGYAALKRGELVRGVLDCTRI